MAICAKHFAWCLTHGKHSITQLLFQICSLTPYLVDFLFFSLHSFLKLRGRGNLSAGFIPNVVNPSLVPDTYSYVKWKKSVSRYDPKGSWRVASSCISPPLSSHLQSPPWIDQALYMLACVVFYPFRAGNGDWHVDFFWGWGTVCLLWLSILNTNKATEQALHACIAYIKEHLYHAFLKHTFNYSM